MSERYIPPAVDTRRHFLVTGTYSSDQAVPSRDLQSAIEKTLMRAFAEPMQIMAYSTPKFHHPYAVDLREQYMKLKEEELKALINHFPHLMTSLMTFLQGAFMPEKPASTVVEVEMDISIAMDAEVEELLKHDPDGDPKLNGRIIEEPRERP